MIRNVIATAAIIGFATNALQLRAQNQAAPSLQSLLATQYKVSTTGSDSEGFRIIEPGTLLIIKKEGIIATPPASPRGLHFKLLPNMCNNTFKNGVLSTASKCSSVALGSKFLKSGEKVYITKFEVNEKSNKIVMDVVECDACNGVTGRSSMKANVVFDFNDQFLQKAEPSQVTDVIDEVLGIEKSAAFSPLFDGSNSPLPGFVAQSSLSPSILPSGISICEASISSKTMGL